MSKLLGKVAIVTGASKGIGRAIAYELAKEGATVAICYNSDKEGAEETLENVKRNVGYGIIVKGELSKGSECKRVVEEVVKHLGKIDILVNNAGKSNIGLFMDFKDEDIEELVKNNLLSVMYMSKYALPYIIGREGSIINISSIWGEMGASCEAVYSASKGGINTFTKALSKEMAPSKVRVNAVSPGVINTSMNASFSQEEKEELKEEIPLGFIGEGREIGRAVVFLASDDSKYITGEIMRVDGGFGR